MSRIGNRTLTIPEGVNLMLKGYTLTVTGPLGELNRSFDKRIKIIMTDNTVATTRSSDTKQNKMLHGTTNSLIEGMMIGVKQGFNKELVINGVGYKANLINSSTLKLRLGFSHDVLFAIPEGITIKLPSQTVIQVSGIDKQQVGEVTACIRALKKPEPYKGKGIKYRGEHIIRKEGKTAGK